ncbi:hypothetical protein Tco_0938953 [Tanacetum coccineum]|uniref:Uncharacterized protein n=1 Tax=Tanacetum coccineum TaxID=301880 RepID=A0ABQ5DLC0_9ASTR
MDSIYRARSATDSSSLTKPIQKSQVVLVDIPENLAKNDSIVTEHGLSSKLSQSPGGSSYMSEGSENSRSFKDSGRSDEEYSEDGASSKEGGSETPQKKAIIEEMVSLEKNQAYFLVRLPAGKRHHKACGCSGFKKSIIAAKGTRLDWWLRFPIETRADYNKIFSPVVKMTTIKLVLSIVAAGAFLRRKPRVQIEGNYVWTDSSTEAMVDDMLVAGSDMAEFNKPKCWAKLVRILLSEGSLSLLKSLGTKSLAEMFTRLVMKEKLKFCAASTSLRVVQPQVNPDSMIAQCPKTAEQKLARKNELKAKSTLLLAIPDEHLLKFHGIKDVKTLWEAIKTRFGGNKELKKMQKTILKQQYENFVALRSEDANLKLLRSLPSAWNTHTLIIRNKSNLDTLNMDDLYNNLKVYEAEIKGQSSSSSNSQNVAFVSSNNTSSTNEAVNTAHDVSAASSQGQAFGSTYADDVMFSFFANQSNSGHAYHEGEEIYKEDMKESKFQWAPRNQGNRNGDNTIRVIPVETPANALVVTDGMGYDWSY